jgi:hypothetical protein
MSNVILSEAKDLLERKMLRCAQHDRAVDLRPHPPRVSGGSVDSPGVVNTR